jgi:mono/diheme cytochrome c family protein
MKQTGRSSFLVASFLMLVILLAACGGQTANPSASEDVVAVSGEEAATNDAEVDGDHDDAEVDGDHDDGEDRAGDDPLAVAAAHAIPEEAAATVNPVAYDEISVTAGAELFSQTCVVCHGPEGKGDGPGAAGLDPKPAELTADHVQANSDGALFYTISEGRPDTAMVSWAATYSEEQRWNLVNFIRSLATE